MPKIQIGNEDLNAARKTQKQAFKLDAGKMDELRVHLKEHKVAGLQQLFDYLIVSGVIYLKRDIIDFVKEENKNYQKKAKAPSGSGKKTEHLTVFMYPSDHQALNRFCIEENIKKFHLFEILINGFINQNPAIIKHVKTCQDLKVTERKKQIVRLLKDEYIDVLPLNDAEQLLALFTKKYDTKEFSASVQEEIVKFFEGKKIAEQEEEKEINEFELKRARIAAARQAMAQVLEPLDVDD